MRRLLIVTLLLFALGVALVGGSAEERQEYQVFLPLYMEAPPRPWRGVAVTTPGGQANNWWSNDHALFTDRMWYYRWWHTMNMGANQVPMIGQQPRWGSTFPEAMRHLEDRDYCGPVLFMNEPERKSQDDYTPENAATLYEWIITERPCLQIIAGGVMWVWNTEGTDHNRGAWWMTEFYDELVQRGLPMPHGWHIHHYAFWRSPASSIDEAAAWMDERGLTGDLWLTEWSVCSGDAAVLREWLDELDAHPRLDRYAYYATRRHDFNWCGPFELVNAAGELTSVGREYVR
jgi:hypothetical protein